MDLIMKLKKMVNPKASKRLGASGFGYSQLETGLQTSFGLPRLLMKAEASKRLRGYVFSLDASFAVFVFMIILMATIFYIRTPFSSQVPDASAVLIASDIISALDKQNVFDTLDTTSISNNINQVLPSNLNMSLKLQIYKDNLQFQETKQVNTDLNESYYKGKWLLIVGNITDVKNFVLVEYKVGFAK